MARRLPAAAIGAELVRLADQCFGGAWHGPARPAPRPGRPPLLIAAAGLAAGLALGSGAVALFCCYVGRAPRRGAMAASGDAAGDSPARPLPIIGLMPHTERVRQVPRFMVGHPSHGDPARGHTSVGRP